MKGQSGKSSSFFLSLFHWAPCFKSTWTNIPKSWCLRLGSHNWWILSASVPGQGELLLSLQFWLTTVRKEPVVSVLPGTRHLWESQPWMWTPGKNVNWVYMPRGCLFPLPQSPPVTIITTFIFYFLLSFCEAEVNKLLRTKQSLHRHVFCSTNMVPRRLPKKQIHII